MLRIPPVGFLLFLGNYHIWNLPFREMERRD
jgi:hypothetical protein